MSLWFAVCSIILYMVRKANGLPPVACFAPFRSDDCGGPPKLVMYYWKPGSRCEVGVWKGCLPSLNMFSDEYECVATCIFSARAAPADYHAFNEIEGGKDFSYEFDGTTGADANTTSSDDNSTVITTDTTGKGTNSDGGATGDGGDKPNPATGEAATGEAATGEAATGEAATDGGATGGEDVGPTGEPEKPEGETEATAPTEKPPPP